MATLDHSVLTDWWGLKATAEPRYRATPNMLRHIFIFHCLSSKPCLILYLLSSMFRILYIHDRKQQKSNLFQIMFLLTFLNEFGVLKATVKPCRASLDYHSVMYMIFVHLILKCLHDFFIIMVLLFYYRGLIILYRSFIKTNH